VGDGARIEKNHPLGMVGTTASLGISDGKPQPQSARIWYGDEWGRYFVDQTGTDRYPTVRPITSVRPVYKCQGTVQRFTNSQEIWSGSYLLTADCFMNRVFYRLAELWDRC
jgi:hypothetical protein